MQGGRRKYQKNLQLRGWIRNDAIEEFGGGKNTGDACSWMGAGAAEEKAANIFGDVVGAEPGALGKDRLKLKCGTDVGIEAGFEVERSKDQLAHEVFSQVGDNGFL